MSNWIENALLNWIFRGAVSPSAYTANYAYLSLHSSDPTDDTAVALSTEISGSGYARNQTSFYYNTSTGVNYMNYQEDFPVSASAWGTITDVGIFTGSASGSLLYHARVYPNDITVNSGHVFSLLGGSVNATVFGQTGSAILGVWAMRQLIYSVINHWVEIPNGLNMYARLFTTLPDFLGNGGVEVPTHDYNDMTLPTGYTSVQVAGASNWCAPTSGSTYNLNTINFFPNYAIRDISLPIVGMAIYYIYYSFNQVYMILPFTESIRIYAGDGLKFLPGQVKIEVQ
jgi:hypothetical protein